MSVSRRTLLTGPLAAALYASLPRAADAADEVRLAVIVARRSSVSNIALTELRRIFMSESIRSDDGTDFIPLNHPPHAATRTIFDRVVLRMSPDAVTRFWIDRRIRGQKGPPKTVDNIALLRRVVASLNGAISYVEASALTDEVRAVRIDGQLPTDKDYPLKGRP